MSFGRFSLIFTAVAFGLYGAAFLFAPMLMTSFVGIELPISSAVIDVRATYGGSVLGTAVFFTLCSLSRELLRTGLVAQTCVLGGFIMGRIVGLVVDRNPNPFIYILLIGELIGFGLALMALRLDEKGKPEVDPSV